ncbi:MAG TPA: GNAT family N-acetyltransferase [Steroidobacteraceae bacterium]|jgi:RimJ/RimL family protein N-acetyltransferase
MQLQPTFPWRTQRVELFLLEPGHVSSAYVGWLSDPEVNRFLESRFATHDLASTQRYVASMLGDANTLFLGIRSPQLQRHVGNIKLGPIDRHHGLGEIGIMIGERAAWGRGIASDSIAVLCRIAFEQLGLRKLTAGCYRSNVGSARAFARAGFAHEATRPAHYLLEGRAEDLILMARHAPPGAP